MMRSCQEINEDTSNSEITPTESDGGDTSISEYEKSPFLPLASDTNSEYWPEQPKKKK
eukprot:CAMPEP_0185575812 /NCGR_PEP_ID=MMETSP0434-20130131/6895_1 /TAXON_ID=626734 ORGANISM="Favella taraikaensis, Strain Fe Narragansett Bay" /NCGR_SAMPLE_ID=MMETSP0434 /ASSEMBLY_ACC=CAM_ASM_000379 /LENGTH=57 /DNA_ID=CAMNT_0028192795 /DNA_START=1747 /DNA_END=1920 /DNA_ORIENTATION=+